MNVHSQVECQRAHSSRALRVGSWRSARLLKGAARASMLAAARRGCFGLGAAARGAGRGHARLLRLPCAAAGCALATAARAQLRGVSGRSRRAGRGWARLTRGSRRAGKRLRGCTERVPVSYLTLVPGALRVSSWCSARLVKGAARAWVCLRCGAAVLGSARHVRRGPAGIRHQGLAGTTTTALRCHRWRLTYPPHSGRHAPRRR